MKIKTLKEGSRRHCLQRIVALLFLALTYVLYGSENGIGVVAHAQSPESNKPISLNFKNGTVREVFKAIEKQSGLNFFYSNNSVNLNQKVSIVVEKEPLRAVLDKLIGGAYDYTIENGLIILSPKSNKARGKVTIRGTIVDETNQPLPSATILEEGTGNGVASDMDGRYILTVGQNSSVSVSFLGYEKQTFRIKKGQTTYNIQLKPVTTEVDEVTVIGYGQRNTKTLIGAVSTVKGDDIKEIPSASFENLLQGRMAGVEITNSSGAPGGGGAIIAIRGYNSMIDQTGLRMNDYGEPLFVIDGVPVQGFTSPITGTNTMSSIDPSTIESIEVLKDAASAAIYGSRAGRGVILITTKKGRKGEAKFSANASYSISQLPSAPVQTGGKEVRHYLLKAMENMRRPFKDPVTGISTFPSNMLDGYNTAKYGGVYNKFWHDAAIGYKYDPKSPPMANAIQDSLNMLHNNSTNWYEYMFRPARVLNTNLQASGGTEMATYLIGAGIYDEKGISRGSDFTRFNFITNLNAQPIRNLFVDSRITFSFMSRHRGGNTGGHQIEYLNVDPRKSSSLAPAAGPILDKMLAAVNGTNEKNENYDVRGSLNLEYHIMEGLKFRTQGSAHLSIQSVNLFQPSTIVSEKLNKSTGETSRSLNLINENILTYNKSFNNTHNLEMMLGQSFEKTVQNIIQAQGFGSISDKIHYIYKGFPILPPADFKTELKVLQTAHTDLLEKALVSSFARIAYNYKYRYLVEMTIRRDGSSVFGANNKYATFPAVAAGWTFSEEPFMEKAWWLSQGKLRLSWGRSGETYPDPYRAFGLLLPAGEYYGRPMVVPDNTQLGGMINRDLKWVLHNQFDAGLDLSLLNYRLKVKLDYYMRRSYGMLSGAMLPKTIYIYDKQVVNANNASNEGIELEIQGDIFNPVTPDGFSWRTRFNISHNRNFLVSTFNGKDVGRPQGIPSHRLGSPLYMMWTFVDGGIYGKPEDIPVVYDIDGNKHSYYLAGKNYPFGVGMKEIKDLNGDYLSNYLDQLYQGSTLPVATGGWSNEFRYKNFDLTMMCTFSLGRKMINAAKWKSLNPEEAIKYPLMVDLRKMKFWEKPGDENIPGVLPMISFWDKTMMQYDPIMASHVENVSYLKLKVVTLGYTVPQEIAKRLHISGLRVFLTGENLLTLTNYSGTDPETVPFMGSYRVAGIDKYDSYPLARKFTLGLSINL